MKRFKKLKLQNRISLIYIILFLFLMVVSNLLIIYLVQRGNNKPLEVAFKERKVLVEEFFTKIESYSNQYDNLVLEFNPKIEDNRVVYSQPFGPGTENFHYIMKIKTPATTASETIPLNTLSTLETKEKPTNVDEISKNIITELEKFEFNTNDTKGKVVELQQYGGVYRVIKIHKEIKGNKFDLYVLRNVNEENKIYSRLEYLILVFTVIGIITIIIFANMISKVILRPINNVIDTARSITAEDLSKRIDIVNREDELGRLSLIINRMLDRLEKSFDNQAKFISDASHELRTPLAIIKGYAEIIKKRKLSNPEVFDESINSIINEVENMGSLVQKLLFLAKGDTANINANFTTIDSEEFIKHIYSDSIVSWKTHNIILDRVDEYYLRADKSLLQQAIRALIENSIKYSKKNTNIYISSEKQGNIAKISIRDEGIGISDTDKERIFERFYRADESRNKFTGGTGLGLAIVSKIVELHKGKVSIESRINKGTKMTIEIPTV